MEKEPQPNATPNRLPGEAGFWPSPDSRPRVRPTRSPLHGLAWQPCEAHTLRPVVVQQSSQRRPFPSPQRAPPRSLAPPVYPEEEMRVLVRRKWTSKGARPHCCHCCRRGSELLFIMYVCRALNQHPRSGSGRGRSCIYSVAPRCRHSREENITCLRNWPSGSPHYSPHPPTNPPRAKDVSFMEGV